MNKKLKCILLIDDDEATNFIHEMVIVQKKCAEKVVTVQSGQDGLNYLSKMVDGIYPQPDIIFLDINMPAMDGWEFLVEYNQLSNNQKASIVVVMLTTSLNPADAEKAESLGMVDGFKSKPLTPKMINDVIKQHFPDYL